LETAIATILRRMDRDTARSIVAGSGTRLDVGGAWAVLRVDLLTRAVGAARLSAIAARHHLPPEVLGPLFDQVAAAGDIDRDGDVLTLTAAGQWEADLLTTAWRTWLQRQLDADGRPADTADIRAAVSSITRRLIDEEDTTSAVALSRV
jgi:hypothetical protein